MALAASAAICAGRASRSLTSICTAVHAIRTSRRARSSRHRSADDGDCRRDAGERHRRRSQRKRDRPRGRRQESSVTDDRMITPDPPRSRARYTIEAIPTARQLTGIRARRGGQARDDWRHRITSTRARGMTIGAGAALSAGRKWDVPIGVSGAERGKRDEKLAAAPRCGDPLGTGRGIGSAPEMKLVAMHGGCRSSAARQRCCRPTRRCMSIRARSTGRSRR